MMLSHQGAPPNSLDAPSVSAQDGPPPGSILKPLGVWKILRRRARLILVIMVLVLVPTIAAMMLIPPKYIATAVLLVDPRQQRVVQSETVLSGIGNDSAAVESQVEVIQSTDLARKVISQLNLDQDPEFASSSVLGRIAEGLRAALQFSTPSPEQRMQRILGRFEDALKVRRRGLTYVIEVGFVSKSADKAARIANAVAEGYLIGQVAVKFDATSQAADWLNERLAELRRQASKAEHAVADYKAEHSLVDTGDRRSIIQQQLSDLNQQLIQARVRAGDAQSRYDQMQKISASSVASNGLPEALQSQVILALRTQYAQAARNAAELAQIYGPLHPSVKAGEAQLESLRHQIAGEIARISAGLRNDLESARRRERALDLSMASLKQDSAATDQANVHLRELEREAEATQTVLQQFLLRFRETSEQQSLQVPDARIISPASAPLLPSSPATTLVLGLAVLGSLALGTGAALLSEAFARSIRSAREAEDLLSLAVLGIVPRVRASELGRRGARLVQRASERADSIGAVDAESLGRFGVDRPLSAFGEAMRGLAIRLRTAHLEGSQVLLVTAALPGEGTSTIAANLASVMAKSGASTLLIDADLRRGSDSRSAPTSGLFQALQDGDSPMFLIKKDPVTGLRILPAGTVDDVGAASELLTGVNMDIVLGHLRREFDIVVIDGPPLLAAVDSHYLLELADAAVLVVAWAHTDRESARAAIEAAGANADKFKGIVLNKVDLEAYRQYDQGSPHIVAAA